MRTNIIILSSILLLPAIFGNTEKNETVFVPTREWQTVKKGTPIPKGLHVKHNFQTGVTEAKLMDDEDTDKKDSNENLNSSNTNSLTLHPEKAIVEEEEFTSVEKPNLLEVPFEQLKARLKKIKDDDEENLSELNDEHAQQVKKKFRDYETLKKLIKRLDVNIKTDSELLSKYFQEFQVHKDAVIMGTLTMEETEEVLDILKNLEYMLHQIDNAKVFADMEGMSKIISPCLNGTHIEIKAEALRVLGAAVQLNPKVKLKAIENDFVQKLLYVLTSNHKMEVKSKCLFAFGALIRQFPAAQKVWINHGGVEIFQKILADDQLQIQIKVLKLMNDLIFERRQFENMDTKERQQKSEVYEATNLEKKLLSSGYCKSFLNFLVAIFKDEFNDQYDNEVMDTVTDSMANLGPICLHQFKENGDELDRVILKKNSMEDKLLQTSEHTRDEL